MAEEMGLGKFLLVFIGVIVGLALLIATAQNIGITRDSNAFNSSVLGQGEAVTSGADGAYVDLVGQELLNTPVVSNNTATIEVGNYTINEGVSATTGVKTIRMRTDDPFMAEIEVNLSYEYGADGYIEDSAGRSIAGLIIIFFALGIAIIVLVPVIKSGIMQN